MDKHSFYSNILPREYYLTDGLALARSLIGKVLVRRVGEDIVAGIISETEAYMGITDKASHAYGGRRTARTETMYLEGGHAYVYLIYGIYSCMNITANKRDNPEAVLIRGVVPLSGFDKMLCNVSTFGKRRTPLDPDRYRKSPHKLTDGPGKLCTAMNIHRELDRTDMCLPGSQLFVADMGITPTHGISESPRIGIDYAEEAAFFPWRYTANHAFKMASTV
ncbi:MAG: DNA-3-methyladenine glycosylase [Ruminococcaceae bacterium]|nr:DNA-3-methyladenine glycosylase [Oscillospiraceae bacterium]